MGLWGVFVDWRPREVGSVSWVHWPVEVVGVVVKIVGAGEERGVRKSPFLLQILNLIKEKTVRLLWRSQVEAQT